MALIVSAASGNFNAGATWVGGVVPGVGDEGRASTGHTITITANATCDLISNAGTGTFVLNSGVTLTANLNSLSNNILLSFSAIAPNSASIVGDITNNNTGGGGAIPSVRNASSGTLNITGNCFVPAGSPNSTPAIVNNSTGVVNITGSVTAGGSTNSQCVVNNSTGTINITGNVTAGTLSGARNVSTGTLSIIGTIQASQTAAGVDGTSAQQVTILSGPFLTETARGVAPVNCLAWRWNASVSNSTYMEVMTNNLLAKRNLVTADKITGMPAASNVKSGITYGPTSELTGTFAQTVTPSTADIATAVWGAATRSITGGTVDTLTNAPASVTPSDIWSHASRTITGGTVDTLTNAPSVPSASAIASQVRTELGVELGRLDASVSSRLAPSGTLAAVTNLTNAPASVTPSDIWSHSSRTLTTSSGPTAVEIRQEIDANSTKLDAAISSRMGASEATKLDAVKAKTDALNTERLANVATTNIVGTLLAQANS